MEHLYRHRGREHFHQLTMLNVVMPRDISRSEFQLRKEIEDSSAERVCLRELTLVDVEVVRFLMACEERGVSIVNRSAYIREWMDRERQQKD